MNASERYEITLDIDDDVSMEEEEELINENSDNTSRIAQQVTTVGSLMSTVSVRRGRGFTVPSSYSAFTSKQPSQSEHDKEQSTLPSGVALAERSVEGWVIFIIGVHEEANEEDLKDKLLDYGHVRDLKLALDHRTGYAKGYAIAEFREYREARAAIDGLSGKPFMGKPIQLDFAFCKQPFK